MTSSKRISTYDDFITFILERIPPEDILAFNVSDEEQEYAIDLLEKNSEGTLTEEELADLQTMRDLDRFIGVLKARALAKLKG